MTIKRSRAELFSYLGAPLNNVQWSWGAVRETDGSVFLVVWHGYGARLWGSRLSASSFRPAPKGRAIAEETPPPSPLQHHRHQHEHMHNERCSGDGVRAKRTYGIGFRNAEHHSHQQDKYGRQREFDQGRRNETVQDRGAAGSKHPGHRRPARSRPAAGGGCWHLTVSDAIRESLGSDLRPRSRIPPPRPTLSARLSEQEPPRRRPAHRRWPVTRFRARRDL